MKIVTLVGALVLVGFVVLGFSRFVEFMISKGNISKGDKPHEKGNDNE